MCLDKSKILKFEEFQGIKTFNSVHKNKFLSLAFENFQGLRILLWRPKFGLGFGVFSPGSKLNF